MSHDFFHDFVSFNKCTFLLINLHVLNSLIIKKWNNLNYLDQFTEWFIHQIYCFPARYFCKL